MKKQKKRNLKYFWPIILKKLDKCQFIIGYNIKSFDLDRLYKWAHFLKIEKFNNIASTLTRSKIGANSGNKIAEDQTICFLQKCKDNINYKVLFDDEKTTNTIRVVAGPQIDFFAKESINKFFSSNDFLISNCC